VKRFRGRLVFKAHRLLHHSTLGLRVNKKEEEWAQPPQPAPAHADESSTREACQLEKDRHAQSLEPPWGRASRLQRCSGSAAMEQDLCKPDIATSEVNWARTLDCVIKVARGKHVRCRANTQHIRQSRPYSDFSFQVKVLKPFWVVPSSLGSAYHSHPVVRAPAPTHGSTPPSSTRWTTTLPSKVTLSHAINFRALGGHVSPGNRDPHSPPCGRCVPVTPRGPNLPLSRSGKHGR